VDIIYRIREHSMEENHYKVVYIARKRTT